MDEKSTGIDVYKMLLHLTGAKTILQLSDSPDPRALADVLPEGGRIVVSLSKPCSQQLSEVPPLNKMIYRKDGTTSDILKEMAASGEQFDMVFIDATKHSHINYYNLIMSSNMLKMNGVICVQNVLVKAHACQEYINDEEESEAKKMTDVISADPGVDQVVLPIDCGIIVARRKIISPALDVTVGVEKDVVFWGYKGFSILDRLRLDGKVAYVTGGGQGIGRAFAHALGEAGAKVAIIDLVLEKAEAVACELQLKGIKSVAMAADISKEEDVKRIVDTIVANWGRIDIACNNAGVNMNSASEDTTLQEWDRTFNVNLRGLFMCCQAAGRVMLSQGYGKIINTASMASLIVPHPQKQLAYNTSKAGVVKLTQTLGTEWIDRGVRVNCISPGIVDTPLIHSDALKPLVQRWLNDIPAGRLAHVTDLQAAVVYLASEASDYMTGHNLVIEGGQSLW
ncbi:D-threitol dehydrogenase-like [Rhinophrynus dorsalis]